MAKRILIFSTAYFPFVGGAEVAVKEITNRIPDAEFVLITARLDAKLPTEEKIGNIFIHRLGLGDRKDVFRLIWSGPKKAQELSPPAGGFDAVWSIMASYAGFAALRYKKRNKTVPFILTLQEGDSKWQIYKHVWWCWCYFKQIFKRADKIQAISNYLAKWAKDMGAKCPIEVIPNGVDIEKFLSTVILSGAKDPFAFKRKLQIPDNAKIVITASRLVKKNGVEDLIKAIKIFNIQYPIFNIQYPIFNIQLLIAGDGEKKNELVKLVEKLDLVSRVHFLGDVPHDELPEYLRASDVFCRPSLSEGLGNAFLEAMACGVPIVGTKVGGIPDFLSDGLTGLFCKKGDPRDIAAKINQLLTDSEFRLRLGENGRKLVELKYSWDLIARRMSNLFGL